MRRFLCSKRWGLSIRLANHKARGRRLGACHPLLELLESRAMLATTPVISEFLASNDRVLDDQDGDDSDWIEIYNPGNEPISLRKWALTDDPDDLTKWRFPDVQLGPSEHLVVFASAKDRDTPGAELHTNFRISQDSGFLALVQPDGATVASKFESYPDQIEDVSYGISTGIRQTKLIASGQQGRILAPTSGSLDPQEPDALGGTWLDPAFDDSSWSLVSSEVGFVPPTTITTLADSVAEFSGVQGQDNWYYGSWAKNADTDKIYASSEFAEMNPTAFFRSDTNKWDVAVGTPPNMEISADGARPSTVSQGFLTQWAIRRWISEAGGEISISGILADDDPAGDGTVGHILVNGTEVYTKVVNGQSENYSLKVQVKPGDLVDFAIDAGNADDEVGDIARFTATISGQPFIATPEANITISSDDFTSDGEQGFRGWTNGYYALSADADKTYQPNNFSPFPAEYWARNKFDWPAGNPPYTEIGKSVVRPNGVDSGPIHWAIRRWTSDRNDTITINWQLSKSVAGGDGVTGRVFHNGVEVDMVQIAGTDRTGVQRSIQIPNVKEGDYIDIALDPTGVGGNPTAADGDDDSSNLIATITRKADYTNHFTTDVTSHLGGNATGLYMRIPFQVEDIPNIDSLKLRMKYDDGFAAYLNGQLIAMGNAPETTRFDSVATSDRDAVAATQFEDFDITRGIDFLKPGANVLQLHVMNLSKTDADFLGGIELIVGTRVSELDQARYFIDPTPAALNGLGATRLGPLITTVDHAPHVPEANQPIVVTAAVNRTFANVGAVTLNYRVMYGATSSVAMVDDGTAGDSAAQDGIFTATIPGGIAEPGQMIRWFVQARDVDGLSSRFPFFRDPLQNEAYQGTVVNDPALHSNLPIIHWFAERPTQAGTAAGSYGSVFYDGEFYDNVRFDLHGQSSQGFPRKSHNVDFPSDHRFRLRDDLQRMKDIDLLSNYADQSLLRNTLAWEQIKATGGPALMAFPVRLHLNGEFYSIYDFVEDADDRWLGRLGLDPNNPLYKIYNSFEAPGGAEKKSRRWEGNEDLTEVINGIRGRNGIDAVDFAFDNIDLASMANFLVGFTMTSNRDCCHKNYFAYRDTTGTGEWSFFHWDQDLSNGRNWGGFNRAYFDDTIYPTNEILVGTNNTLITLLWNRVPGFQEMFLRRLRTVMDEYVKPPGTPYSELPLETRVDELFELMKDDAALHNQENPTNWGQTGFRTFPVEVDLLKNAYSGPRREWLYTTQVVPDESGITPFFSGDPGQTTARYFVPTDNSLGTTWTAVGFNDASWKTGPTGLGFETTGDDFVDLIKTNVQSDMTGRTSMMVRVPFTLDSLDNIQQMTLRMKFDDGYVAYLNGVEIARKGLPAGDISFDSRGRSRSDQLAVQYDNVEVTSFINQLRVGENVLAIHAFNSSPENNDMLVLPELVNGLISSSRGTIPTAQKGNPKIDFGTIEYNPSSKNQDQEYLELVNNNNTAVDISRWKLVGDINMTFKPGTVIPTGGKIYVTPNAKAFRARTEGPSGGQQLFVVGNYEGRLPSANGQVQLVAADGQVVNSTTYVGETTPTQDALRITEINYNPLGPSPKERAADVTLDADDFEFIELLNTSESVTLNLAGVRLSGGIQFDFTDSQVKTLGPGQRALVVKDVNAFQIRYGTDMMSSVAGQFVAGSGLGNNGDSLQLLDENGSVITDFQISNDEGRGWPIRADGRGSSLQVVDVNGDYSRGSNWRASSRISGTPGTGEAAPAQTIVVNEVSSNTNQANMDSIELYNVTSQAISLNHYFLSDSTAHMDELAKYAIPATKTISAASYLVFTEADFNASGGPNDFGLNGDEGDQVYLTVGDANGPTHFVDSISFGAAAEGETFGRMVEGDQWIAPMKQSTIGYRNSDPRVGPVIISEIQYNPGSPSPAALDEFADLDSNDLEFIEIHNPQSAAVTLTDWRIRGGVDFDFPPGQVLGAGETLIVLSFDPAAATNAARLAAFRGHYGLGQNVKFVGGYSGQLNNGGDRVTLQRPGAPVDDDPVLIPRLLEDEVIYSNVPKWPADADGSGSSLNRVTSHVFGSDPINWRASMASPGSVSFVSGDVDGSNSVDPADVQAVCGGMRQNDAAFDYDRDGSLSLADVDYYVRRIVGTTFGDSNVDGRFDSSDLTRVLQSGEYEDQISGNSTWSEGDWNCDGDFSTSDLVVAFMYGQYEQAAAAVTEGRTDADGAIATGGSNRESSSADVRQSHANGIVVTNRTNSNQHPLSPSRIDSLFEFGSSLGHDRDTNGNDFWNEL
jgi:hypothetical protein